MADHHTSSRLAVQGLRSGYRRSTWALSLLLPLVLASCSGGGGAGGQARDGDEDYPNLARVPDEAPRPTPASLRKDLVEGLVADRANAQYTGELLTPETAAVPPAAPPPAAQPQVEVRWDTLRVATEDETPAAEDEASEAPPEDETSEAVPEESTSAAEQVAAEPEVIATAASADAGERVEINWDTDRVEPSGELTVAGTAKSQGKLLLAPQPELVAVIYFPQNSAQIEQSDRTVLASVIELYKERGGRIHLIGHSSSETGSEDQVAQRMVNLDLSLKRANAVATTLVDLGAAQDAVLVEAKADSEAVANRSIVGAGSGNRRVEIFLEY